MKWIVFPSAILCTALFTMIGTAFFVSDFYTTDNPYLKIEMKEVFSERIVREKDDREYSGQIKSQKGLKAFATKYSLDLKLENVDFDKQILIFGITDNISTRAFRFLKQKNLENFCLDYYDSGEMHKLKPVEAGKKYSHLQVFVIAKLEGIPHIMVKNLEQDKLSKVYE